LVGAVAWLGNAYVGRSRLDDQSAYGGMIPESIGVLFTAKTDQLTVSEFSLAKSGTKIGIAVATGQNLTSSELDLLKIAREFQVDRIESPLLPNVLIRYLTAQFEVWRSGDRDMQVVSLLGKKVVLHRCKAKNELRYAVAAFQTPEGAAVLVAQRRGELPDPAEIEGFINAMPRFSS
jgi:hypothetical protein